MAERIEFDPLHPNWIIPAWGSAVYCVNLLLPRLPPHKWKQSFLFITKEVIVIEKWGFLNTGFQTAAVNMAMDEALLNWHKEGLIPPTLRFYGWRTPSLSVGRFQKVNEQIDLAAVDHYHCDFVRRLTGGSAVLHDDELTYSIVVTEEHPNIPQTVREAYHVLTKGILEGYRNLGIQADYAYPTKMAAKKDRSAVCFEQVAYYEMVVDGKKLSGNAQTRKDGVLLQHGSIPMSINEEMLFDLFLFPSEQIKEQKRQAFANKAIAINQITNKKHMFDQLVKAFYKGFQTGLNVTFTPLTLTQQQWDEVHHLAKTKYATLETEPILHPKNH